MRTLSGGERNRLLLARLFAKPLECAGARRTHQRLDIETLDLLEELLADYPGTVFLVSHDRRFLDNVVTSTPGGRRQWFLARIRRWRGRLVDSVAPRQGHGCRQTWSSHHCLGHQTRQEADTRTP